MSLTDHVLAKATPERLKKAVDGLVANAYTISLIKQDTDEIAGFVTNGDQVQYSVVITASRVFCSCKDSMFRHTTCKHSVALALFSLRNPRQEAGNISTENGISQGGTISAEPVLDNGGTMSVEEMRTYNLSLVKARKGFGQRCAV
jgi:hypothetical protein